jgi:hypothetical protein
MQTLNWLAGDKYLVDVTGFEPATPCLQILGARKINNLPGIATGREMLPQMTTPKGVSNAMSILGSYQ